MLTQAAQTNLAGRVFETLALECPILFEWAFMPKKSASKRTRLQMKYVLPIICQLIFSHFFPQRKRERVAFLLLRFIITAASIKASKKVTDHPHQSHQKHPPSRDVISHQKPPSRDVINPWFITSFLYIWTTLNFCWSEEKEPVFKKRLDMGRSWKKTNFKNTYVYAIFKQLTDVPNLTYHPGDNHTNIFYLLIFNFSVFSF